MKEEFRIKESLSYALICEGLFCDIIILLEVFISYLHQNTLWFTT